MITLSPPCASMSREHLRIHQSARASELTDVEGGLSARRGSWERPLPLDPPPLPPSPPPSSTSSQPPGPDTGRTEDRLFKKDGNVSQACTRKCSGERGALPCTKVRKIRVTRYFTGRIHYFLICIRHTGKIRGTEDIS